jgi:restriction system protein
MHPVSSASYAAQRSLSTNRRKGNTPLSRRRSTGGNGGPLLVLALIAIGLIMAAIKATDGLILLVAPLGVYGLVLRRRHQRVAEQAAHQSRMRFATDLNRLLSLHPRDFELLVGEILKARGFTHVKHVGGSHDRGADLLATEPSGRRVVVQCKRNASSNKVGGGTVRNLIGAVQLHQAQSALLVTTSTFTQEAVHAANVAGLGLMDGAAVVEAARVATMPPPAAQPTAYTPPGTQPEPPAAQVAWAQPSYYAGPPNTTGS